MSSYLSSRLEADPAVEIVYGAEVVALHGGEHLEAVTVRDANTGETRDIETRALFIMVGAAPNTEWLSGLVKLDGKGFVITGSGNGSAGSPFATSLPGVFAQDIQLDLCPRTDYVVLGRQAAPPRQKSNKLFGCRLCRRNFRLLPKLETNAPGNHRYSA